MSATLFDLAGKRSCSKPTRHEGEDSASWALAMMPTPNGTRSAGR